MNYTNYVFEEEEEVDGQIVERRCTFTLDGLDYMFSFSPSSDSVDGGATLTYVGTEKQGRLSPSKHANDHAWTIANAALAY